MYTRTREHATCSTVPSSATIRVVASPPKEQTIRVPVYLPEPLVIKLRHYADKRNIGLSVLIRMMLSASMEREPQ